MVKTNSDQQEGVATPDSYEATIINKMWIGNLSLGEALYVDMWDHSVDTDDVYNMVDFLEERLENLDKVQYYMMVMTGQCPDVILKANQ